MTEPYFNPLRGMRKVDLEGGFWVRLRHVTVDESLEIQRLSEDNNSKAGILGLIQAIHDWNLTTENGEVAEINEAWVGKLPGGDFKKLVDTIGEMEGVVVGTMTPAQEVAAKAQQVKFPDGASNSSQLEQLRTSRAAGVPDAEGAVGSTGPQA